ncbi:DUF881 domain-containing protein [Jonesiaceae bacterium BS-20]|uniref:DUF881 domain-containing protein n=1 Tax=Jonesiaceae bacterium BS-20 TaxID=3120821 RepID=A0AAU7DUS3_9MICO
MAKKKKNYLQQLQVIGSIAVVIALSVVMFGASARLANRQGHRHPEDLAELVSKEVERQNDLLERVDALQISVDELTDAQVQVPGSLSDDVALGTKVSAGTVALEGPGARVALWDAPTDSPVASEFQPDDLVVHQQDLQAVINALWAGGAEAMTLQGQRVTATTAFRCVGNVLLLHGQVYSPPYVVEVVGDQDKLGQALEDSEELAIYQQYVEIVGLGFSKEFPDSVQIPASTGSASLKYATVPPGVSVWN